MAYFSEINLPRFREEDLPGTTKKLYNVVRELQEMLQFVLSNLDGDNIERYEEVFNRLEGADGAVSILKQTADEISAEVRKNGDKIAKLSVTAEAITQRVSDTEKGVGELKVTAESISQRVSDNEGNIGSLTVTAQGLEARVQDTEGNVSVLQQTAKGLESRVSDAEGGLSSLEQTAERISSRVSDAETGLSSITQTAGEISSTVSDLSGKYTSLKQTVDGFDFTGVVRFGDLSGAGESEIDGRNIKTGKIALERLELENDYGYVAMGEGSTGYFKTRGIRVAGPAVDDLGEYRNHLLATNAGIRVVGEDMFGYESIWLSADEIEATSVISTVSDGRVKNSVAYDVAERYGAFYKALKPARYHMNASRSWRFHTGFVAQQVRDALEAGGLGRGDLAALVQQDYDPQAQDGGGGQYSIRYGELVALNTAMVQSLMARVDALEGLAARVDALETNAKEG